MNCTHWESKVAGRLGLSRDTMRALRAGHLVYLADWETISGRICLTEDAVGKIAAVLRLPPDLAPAVSEPHLGKHVGLQLKYATDSLRRSARQTRP